MNEVELAVINTSGLSAADWTVTARPHINALIGQGLTVSMIHTLMARIVTEVE